MNNKRRQFSNDDQTHLLVRMLIMVKAEDLLFLTIDEFYLNILLDLFYINHSETKLGVTISQDGKDFIKRYQNTILPGPNKDY